jgi:hypothetical protein
VAVVVAVAVWLWFLNEVNWSNIDRIRGVYVSKWLAVAVAEWQWLAVAVAGSGSGWHWLAVAVAGGQWLGGSGWVAVAF